MIDMKKNTKIKQLTNKTDVKFGKLRKLKKILRKYNCLNKNIFTFIILQNKIHKFKQKIKK